MLAVRIEQWRLADGYANRTAWRARVKRYRGRCSTCIFTLLCCRIDSTVWAAGIFSRRDDHSLRYNLINREIPDHQFVLWNYRTSASRLSFAKEKCWWIFLRIMIGYFCLLGGGGRRCTHYWSCPLQRNHTQVVQLPGLCKRSGSIARSHLRSWTTRWMPREPRTKHDGGTGPDHALHRGQQLLHKRDGQ